MGVSRSPHGRERDPHSAPSPHVKAQQKQPLTNQEVDSHTRQICLDLGLPSLQSCEE